MDNIEKFTNDFATTLKEKSTNFNNWVAASTAIINGIDCLNKTANTIKELDDSLINLKKKENATDIGSM